MVWITKEGDAFHRDRNCPALIAGQRYAEGRGQHTHEPDQDAVTDGLDVVTVDRSTSRLASSSCTSYPEA
jgi:hypothetical protein